MITSLTTKWQKRIAWMMFFIFYGDMVASAENWLGLYSGSPVSERLVSHLGKLSLIQGDAPSSGRIKIGAAENDKGPRLSVKKTSKKPTIGGPGQPEMTAFSSVNSNNMVDLFSGDFSYNVPLMDVGGYPIGLSYKSGLTMDQEASWVGLGWNINPGTISRSVRGLPDDFNGTEKIEKQMNVNKNWTAGINVGAGTEIFGGNLPINLNVGAFYNNYNGIGVEAGVAVELALRNASGIKVNKANNLKIDSTFTSAINLNLGLTLSSQKGMDLDASLAYKYEKYHSSEKGESKLSANYNSRSGLGVLQLTSSLPITNKFLKNLQTGLTEFTSISFAKSAYTPTMTIPFSNYGFSLNLKAGGELFGIHPNLELGGSYNNQYIADKDRLQNFPAYGYMYSQKATYDKNALLDFNREKDITYRNASPHIGIPVYTHDVYSISGEGVGGMFRPYRGDAGYIHDHRMKSKTGSGKLALDFGAGNLVIVGGSASLNYSTVENSSWEDNNMMVKKMRYTESDSNYEAVYFRNPNEQTTNGQDYYDKIGNDDVVRAGLSGGRVEPYANNQLKRFDKQQYKGSIYLNAPIVKTKRDKRTQVISYLTAEEAQRFALDTAIKNYPVNVFPRGKCDTVFQMLPRNDGPGGLHKPNHISEITVLNGDGKRYVYGIPAYNILQKEATFAVGRGNNGDNNTGLVSYAPFQDNTVYNNKGKDHYFTSEKTPGYAHSFLLTSLLSADYVDVTGDGVTEDDIGDAVKFNYSRMKWNGLKGIETNYKWRTPFSQNTATYNEGLKADRDDDKGSYIYGEKEIWYLNSIESKSMIATFVLSENDRKDTKEAADENGGAGSRTLKSLKEINLYSKADLIKNGTLARPIKTVHFAYSYKLCRNNPANSESIYDSTGKLTLDSVWFSYNNNNRAVKNKYRFTYHQNNPDYNNKSYDRWGNYKPQTDNPGSIPNVDYPYATEDKTKADNNAGAWNLSQVALPSGAQMNVDYESDDYAYVQNKRAADMFPVAGMGNSSNLATATPYLYAKSFPFAISDYQYVFINVPKAVTGRDDLYKKYLEGIDKIFFQLLVKMPPSDNAPSAFERVPFFGEYEDYGTTTNANIIWVKLKNFGRNQTFPTIASLQFMKQNLPGRAFPGSDVSDNAAFKQVILAIIGAMRQFKDALIGFNKSKRQEGACEAFDQNRSFVRLNNPYYVKMGGGLRVKRITIHDNWNAMTNQKEAVYGQEYSYTVDTVINQTNVRISSGVASYEPSIGIEENPFYLPIEYTEKVTLAPKEFFSSFYPLGETYFPSPSVGYSKVTVNSINKKNLKSFNGWDVSEFYTTRDFPTITDYTTFDNESKKLFKFSQTFGGNISIKRATLSQGFKVEVNDMNGKLKSQRSYAAIDSINPISYTYNYYKTVLDNVHATSLSNTVPVMENPSGNINPTGTINKDIELISDSRQQLSLSYGVTVPFNADVFIIGIFPVSIPSFFPKFSIGSDRYRSFATMKLIQRYGILDSVLHYEKGSLVSTKNMVYDAETGEVIVSRTQNEFNDPIYSFNYPAHWEYSGMGHAYKNIGALFKNQSVKAGKLLDPYIERYLESGDEIAVLGKSFTPIGDPKTDACIAPDWSKAKFANKLWVVDINKATVGSTTRNLFLVDKNGDPYYGKNATFKIIRSGKRNVLGALVGSFTCLRNPIQVINSTQWLLSADSSIGVIASNASTYKDYWAVDNKFNSVTTCTGGIDPSCDSLGRILKGFVFSYGNPLVPPLVYNADGCDISTWTFPQTVLLVNGTVKYKEMFHNGYAGLPDRVDTMTVGGVNIIRTPAINSEVAYARCIKGLAGGFIYEARIKAPFDTTDPAQHFLLFGINVQRNGGSQPDYIYISQKYQNVAGYAIDGNSVSNIAQLVQRFDQNFRILKIIAANNFYTIYMDGVFLYQAPYTGTITGIDITALQFYQCKGIVDWVKISDITNKVIVNEQFNTDCSGPFAIPKPKYRCNTLDCQTAFVNYFNGRVGGNFTFSQIDSIYRANCRYFYDPCLDTTYYVKDTCITDCKSIFTHRFNPYTEGFWGTWRSDRAYTFYDSRKQNSTGVITDIRRDGEFKKFVPFWNFDPVKLTSSNYAKWVWNSEMTRFNKKGMETENKDPLGRYNSGLYGYNQILPVAVAQNAKYRQIAYEGFEDYYFTNDSCGQRCPPPRQFDWSAYKNQLSTTEKHSGLYSLKIPVGQSDSLNFTVVTKTTDTTQGSILVRTNLVTCNRLDSIYSANDNITTPIFSPIQGDSLVIGLWAKDSIGCKCDSFINNKVLVRFYNGSNALVGTYAFKAAGNIIEGWQRYENFLAVPLTAVKGTVVLQNISSGGTSTSVYFDDLRMHPFNSNIKTFVYNATNLRLMAELDENNYASFYEYDDEGTLIRVKKETQLGVKTIKETRSAILKQ